VQLDKRWADALGIGEGLHRGGGQSGDRGRGRNVWLDSHFTESGEQTCLKYAEGTLIMQKIAIY